MERFTRNKALVMALAIIVLLSILALLTNISPSSSFSLNNSNHNNADSPIDILADDDMPLGDEEDLVKVDTKPVPADQWQPKKTWGRLSSEIETAIAHNVRITTTGRGDHKKEERILLTAVVNGGMSEYTLNWIASLKKCGLDDQYLVFAIDQDMVDVMTKAGFSEHVVLIPKEWFHTELSDKFESWLSDGYTPITHSKSLVVERLLYTDVTVWFSDVDIVFTNPSIYDYLLMKLKSREYTETMFSQETEQKMVNSGFYVMRPTDTNKRILEESIYIQDTEKGKKPEVTQQRAMNRVVDEINLNYQNSPIVLLDLMLFPQGKFYFDKNMPTKFGLEPMIVHANYRKGDNKKKDLIKHGLWYI